MCAAASKCRCDTLSQPQLSSQLQLTSAMPSIQFLLVLGVAVFSKLSYASSVPSRLPSHCSISMAETAGAAKPEATDAAMRDASGETGGGGTGVVAVAAPSQVPALEADFDEEDTKAFEESFKSGVFGKAFPSLASGEPPAKVPRLALDKGRGKGPKGDDGKAASKEQDLSDIFAVPLRGSAASKASGKARTSLPVPGGEDSTPTKKDVDKDKDSQKKRSRVFCMWCPGCQMYFKVGGIAISQKVCHWDKTLLDRIYHCAKAQGRLM